MYIYKKKTLGTVSFPGVRSTDARRTHSNNDIVNLKCKRYRIREKIYRIYFRSTPLYFKLFLKLLRNFATI